MASIPGIWFFNMFPSGLCNPGCCIPAGDNMAVWAAAGWLNCMNCMWFKCVGGWLYPFAKSGDFSSLGGSLKKKQKEKKIMIIIKRFKKHY